MPIEPELSIITSSRPGVQAGQVIPPQSTPTSLPFFMPSVQLDPMHRPFAHTPFAQSAATRQARPSAHFGQPMPPQSTSVSAPFLTPSLHEAAAQTPLRQMPLTQSDA